MVTTLNVTHLNVDIESNELTNSADNNLTGQALAQVRSWGNANGTPTPDAHSQPDRRLLRGHPGTTRPPTPLAARSPTTWMSDRAGAVPGPQ